MVLEQKFESPTQSKPANHDKCSEKANKADHKSSKNINGSAISNGKTIGECD